MKRRETETVEMIGRHKISAFHYKRRAAATTSGTLRYGDIALENKTENINLKEKNQAACKVSHLPQTWFRLCD